MWYCLKFKCTVNVCFDVTKIRDNAPEIKKFGASFLSDFCQKNNAAIRLITRIKRLQKRI